MASNGRDRGRAISPWRSLRVRLALFSAIASAVLWVLLGAWVYLSLRQGLLGQVDAALRSVAEEVAATLAVPDRTIRYHDIAEAVAGREGSAGIRYVQIVSSADQVMDTSEELEGAPIPPVPALTAAARLQGEVLSDLPFRDEPVRLISLAVRASDTDGRVVQVGMPLTPVLATLRRARLGLVLGTPLVLLGSCLIGVLLAGRALQPIAAITRQAQRITVSDLRQHLAVQYPDELGELAATLNGMFDRLDEAFCRTDEAYRQLQRFSADASHELRTPLTALRGEADVARRQPRSAEEYREALERILKSAERMSRIVEDLMLLARADAEEIELAMEPVQLDILMREVVEDSVALAGSKGVQLTVADFAAVDVLADEIYLYRLAANLLDNAICYTPGGGEVAVELQRVGEQAVVTVRDAGIGIAAEHLPHIFERFYRVDKARSRELGGSGLGLAIAAWIASAHGANLEVESKPGQGTTFTLTMRLGDQDCGSPNRSDGSLS